MSKYQRHLPHKIPDGYPIFVTWNLKGAIPREAIERLNRERQILLQEPRWIGESPRDRSLRHGKLIFAKVDEDLDRAKSGRLHLNDAVASRIVEDAILFGTPERYDLFAWCVMANHVHLLITPKWALSKITMGLKGYTSREINRVQRASGRTFWQDESYDHWARDEDELLRIIAYIENNPAKAGLCSCATNWPWSSARFRGSWPVGQAFQPDENKRRTE